MGKKKASKTSPAKPAGNISKKPVTKTSKAPVKPTKTAVSEPLPARSAKIAASKTLVSKTLPARSAKVAASKTAVSEPLPARSAKIAASKTLVSKALPARPAKVAATKTPVISATSKAKANPDKNKSQKLMELLKKQNVSAKKTVNVEKMVKELGFPSEDELSDSDLDIFEDSEDGLVYNEDSDAEDMVSDDEMDADEEEEEEEEQEMDVDHSEPLKEDDAESDEEADFEIIKTVEKLDPKTEGRKFEFVFQGRVAMKALASHCSGSKKANKMQLFDDANGVYMNVHFKLPAFIQTVNKTVNRQIFEFPCPEKTPSNSSVCLILPDFTHNREDARDPDVSKQAREWSDVLRERFGITGRDVAKVYTLLQLRREVRTLADKAQLSRAYDIFLVDRSIYTAAIYHLGSEFQKGGRLPLPLKITAKNVPEQIKKSYRLGQIDTRPGLNAISIRIGNLSQDGLQLGANFISAADCLFRNVHGGSANIQSASICTDENKIQLPFFVDFGLKAKVPLKKPTARPVDIVEDELTSLADHLAVRFENGKIRVVDKNTGKYTPITTALKKSYVKDVDMGEDVKKEKVA